MILLHTENSYREYILYREHHSVAYSEFIQRTSFSTENIYREFVQRIHTENSILQPIADTDTHTYRRFTYRRRRFIVCLYADDSLCVCTQTIHCVSVRRRFIVCLYADDSLCVWMNRLRLYVTIHSFYSHHSTANSYREHHSTANSYKENHAIADCTYRHAHIQPVWYSRLLIGWHWISRLFQKKFQRTRILTMGFTISNK